MVPFTMRRMMALVAVVAIFLGTGRWAYLRYAGQTFAKAYYVGDLVHRDPGSTWAASQAALDEQAELLRSSVTPEMWWFGKCSITPFYLSMSLIIRHMVGGHARIKDYFNGRREKLRVPGPSSL